MSIVNIRNETSKDEWELLCSTGEEWEELAESFRGSKQSYERSLFKVLNDELLPDILQMITAKVNTVLWVTNVLNSYEDSLWMVYMATIVG